MKLGLDAESRVEQLSWDKKSGGIVRVDVTSKLRMF